MLRERNAARRVETLAQRRERVLGQAPSAAAPTTHESRAARGFLPSTTACRMRVPAMRRIDELLPLSRDHHSALVLARRCRQAALAQGAVGVDEAWLQVRSVFPVQLEPHFVIEESVLLPALEAVGETQLAARVRQDHASLRALAAVEAATADIVEQFGKLLETHVRFEERQVFEVAQAKLPAAALAAIAEACASTPRTAPACAME